MVETGRDALDWSVPDEVPEGRCGFTTEYIPSRYQEVANNVTCWRESWDEHDQCIWHADVAGKPVDGLAVARADSWERLDGAVLRETDLENAITFANCVLNGADLTDASLGGADLTDASLGGADLTDASLGEADLTHASLGKADLTHAFLQEADFTNAFLREVDLTDAHLAGADLPDADLRGADLTDAVLAGTTLEGVTLEEATLKETSLAGADLNEVRPAGSRMLDLHLTPETDFGDRCGYDRDATEMLPESIRPRPRSDATDATGLAWLKAKLTHIGTWPARAIRAVRRWRYLRNLDGEAAKEIAEKYDEAQTTYRTFEQLARENALPAKIPKQFVRGKDARRKQALAENDTRTWAWLATQRWITGYGESPARVVGTSLVVIVVCALLYPFLGGVAVESGGTPMRFFTPVDAPLTELPGGTWLANFYFSLVTFTTLGYGDIQPASAPAQLLAGIQSLLGAALLALLVAVLARRITR